MNQGSLYQQYCYFSDIPVIQPGYQSKYEGENAKFKCFSNNPVSWKLLIDKNLPENVKISGNFDSVITIYNITTMNWATYVCITRDYQGRQCILEGHLVVHGEIYCHMYEMEMFCRKNF